MPFHFDLERVNNNFKKFEINVTKAYTEYVRKTCIQSLLYNISDYGENS